MLDIRDFEFAIRMGTLIEQKITITAGQTKSAEIDLRERSLFCVRAPDDLFSKEISYLKSDHEDGPFVPVRFRDGVEVVSQLDQPAVLKYDFASVSFLKIRLGREDAPTPEPFDAVFGIVTGAPGWGPANA